MQPIWFMAVEVNELALSVIAACMAHQLTQPLPCDLESCARSTPVPYTMKTASMDGSARRRHADEPSLTVAARHMMPCTPVMASTCICSYRNSGLGQPVGHVSDGTAVSKSFLASRPLQPLPVKACCCSSHLDDWFQMPCRCCQVPQHYLHGKAGQK